MNLPALGVRPRLLRQLGRPLNRSPAAKRFRRQNQAAPAARSADDPPPRGIEKSRTARRRYLSATDAAIERWRETKQRKSANLERKQGLVRGQSCIERLQEPYRSLEDRRFGLVIGNSLADDRQRCAGRPNRVQASKNPVKRVVYRHALQMRELPASGAEVRVHQDVGLQRTAEPPLALSRAASKRRDLAVVLG